MRPDETGDNDPRDNDAEDDMPTGDEPTDDVLPPADADTAADEDLSREVQSDVSRLENGVWHAPRGKGTRLAATLILILMGASLIGLIALAIITAMS